MKPDIIVNFISIPNYQIDEIAYLIKKIGFDGVMIGKEALQEDIIFVEAAKKANLKIDCIHLPILPIHSLWTATNIIEVEKITNLYTSIIDYAHKNNVKNVVMHAFIGFINDVEITEERLARFEKIISYANDKEIYINFENTEGEIYLDAILKKYTSKYPYLKFCLDTGHEMCYNNFRDMLKDYGKILNYIHINDNLGVSNPNLTWENDYHYLPGDGLLDINNIARRIKDCNYKGSITLELKPNQEFNTPLTNHYKRMGIFKYYKKAFSIASKIASKSF